MSLVEKIHEDMVGAMKQRAVGAPVHPAHGQGSIEK